ncbi:hypothetical protein RJT34_19153 [Clitoria ternatea]|uniref:Uncharacterized protein n=1 Tax=Clitoria ternatea TaxID=43366 RepID=A0AAN9IQH6_CLITE
MKAHCHHHWPTPLSPSMLHPPRSTLQRNYTAQLYSVFVHGFLTCCVINLVPTTTTPPHHTFLTLMKPTIAMGLGFEGCVLGLNMMNVDDGRFDRRKSGWVVWC